MFFPEEQKFLAGEVDRYHLVYTNPGKWNSSSPYETTFQHKNALIVLYDIARGERQPHADGFFPKTLDERIVDTSGWIFARNEKVYLGVYPLSASSWTEEDLCWRWRSTSLQTGWVVEVSSGRGIRFVQGVSAGPQQPCTGHDRFRPDGIRAV